MTSQNPSPPSATEKNLSRETYLPRRIPSTSNPPIFTVRIPSRLNSSRSDSICAARGLAVSMNSLRRTRIKQIVSARSAATLASAIGERLLRLGAAGLPILGVCFGHQLLGRASGSSVVRNPKGREIGTVRVQLTPDGRKDPLFSWSQKGEIAVQAPHLDVVDSVPAGATLLASNEACATQAFRLSETVAAVQFHPEITAEIMRDLIGTRAAPIRHDTVNHVRLTRVSRATRSARILRPFSALR